MSGRDVPPLVPCDPPNWDGLPAIVRKYDRCVAWRNEGDPDPTKPPRKTPYRVGGNRPASVIDRRNWCSLAAAQVSMSAGIVYSGVGYVLGPIDDTGFDLNGLDGDTCLELDGTVSPWAVPIVGWMKRTYAETSVSHTGIKALFITRTTDRAAIRELFSMAKDATAAKFPAGVPHVGGHPPGIDLYCERRYFALTGWRWEGAEAEVKQVSLDDLRELAELLPKKANGKANGAHHAAPGAGGGKRDASRSGKAWRAAKRLIRRGIVATVEELREELLRHSDADVVSWTEDKGDDRQLQRMLDKIERPEEWALKLRRDMNGAPYPNVFNAIAALQYAPDLTGIVATDEMTRLVMLTKDVPESGHAPMDKARMIGDTDYTSIQSWMQRYAEMPKMGRETVIQAILAVAARNSFNPVKDYLDDLVWDGTPRVDTWLIRHCGAEDNPYTSTVSRMVLLSMVARAYMPGCRCDYVMVLQGEQGIQKSHLLRTLAGDWFDDHLPSISGANDVRASMHLRGKWIIEISELHAFSKSDIEKLKAFITRPIETYTPLHARAEVHEPRVGILVGTTNRDVFLRDETGNRRFLPVRVGMIDVEGVAAERDQLFAEAVTRRRAGEAWWPDRDVEAEEFAPEQEERFERDLWEDPVVDWLCEQESGAAPKIDPISAPGEVAYTVAQVARGALELEPGRMSHGEGLRISAILRRAGWQRRNIRGHNGAKLWIPPNAPNPPRVRVRRGKV